MSTKKKGEAAPLTPMEKLLGPKLATNVKGGRTTTVDAFKDKEVVALYFSAQWCPPCRAFSPILKDFYKGCADKGKLEIVYISSDKNLAQWQEYYGTMPWLSLPEGANESSSAIKNKLAQTMKIQGIPTMIVLEVKTGNFVTVTGRDDVTKAGSDATKGDEVIQAWKAIDAVPLEEADMGAGATGPTGIMAVVFYILKNPIYIFGLLYFYKQAVKYFNGGAAGGGPIEAEPVEQHDPSEF